MRQSDSQSGSNVSCIFDVPAYKQTLELLSAGAGCEAKKRAERLIAKGDAHGYGLMGALYEFGASDLAPDPEKALHNYTMAVELDGSVEGALGYARIKYLGKTGAPDLAEAARVYDHIASLGNRVAHYMIAKILLDGSPTGEQISAARGHASAALQLGLRSAKDLLSLAATKEGKSFQALRWSFSALLDRLGSRSQTERTI